MLTCKEFLQELTDYLDENVDAEIKAKLEQHITECPNCWVVCDTTKKTIEIYRDSKLYELPEDLETKLRTAIASRCKSHKKTGPEGSAR